MRATVTRMEVKLRVELGENDHRKLSFQEGLPSSVGELEKTIRKQFDVRGDFRLQYFDKDFEGFMNVSSIADISDKGTIKLVIMSVPDTDSSEVDCSIADCSASSGDTLLIDTPPTSITRKSWPLKFDIPTFPYDIEKKLQKGNELYQEEGTLLPQGSINKSAILEKLAETIYGYKAYPTDMQLSQVASALVEVHPCLREPHGGGFYGWKTSLKYKMGNYRTKLRGSGVTELTINSLERKRMGAKKSAKDVKKAKKAEVNYLPDIPAGETVESLEKARKELLNEIMKRDNDQVVALKMATTFSARRQEVVTEKPLVSVIKERWPALFTESQVRRFE